MSEKPKKLKAIALLRSLKIAKGRGLAKHYDEFSELKVGEHIEENDARRLVGIDHAVDLESEDGKKLLAARKKAAAAQAKAAADAKKQAETG